MWAMPQTNVGHLTSLHKTIYSFAMVASLHNNWKTAWVSHHTRVHLVVEQIFLQSSYKIVL